MNPPLVTRYDMPLSLGERAPMAPDWQALSARLAWRHGPEHTASILAGQDAPTNADLRAWRALGSRA